MESIHWIENLESDICNKLLYRRNISKKHVQYICDKLIQPTEKLTEHMKSVHEFEDKPFDCD